MTFKNLLNLAVAISQFGRKWVALMCLLPQTSLVQMGALLGFEQHSNRMATECDCLNGVSDSWVLLSPWLPRLVASLFCWSGQTVVAIYVAFCFSRYSPFNITMCQRITCGFEQTTKPKYKSGNHP